MDEFENSPSAVQKNISSLQITPLIQISAADFGVKKLIRNPQTPVNMIHDVIHIYWIKQLGSFYH